MCGLTCKSISTVIDICKDGKEALGLRRCFLYVYVYIYVAYMYCTYTALAKTVKYFNADFANLRTSVTTNRLARAFVISPSARKLNAPRNPGPQDRNRVIPKINHFPVIRQLVWSVLVCCVLVVIYRCLCRFVAKHGEVASKFTGNTRVLLHFVYITCNILSVRYWPYLLWRIWDMRNTGLSVLIAWGHGRFVHC